MKRYFEKHLVLVSCIAVLLFTAVYAFTATKELSTRDRIYPTKSYSILADEEIRASAVLTTSYVDTDIIDLSGHRIVAICFDLTQGSLTSFQYKIYISHNGNTWFQEASESVAAATITDYAHNYTYTFTGTDDYYKILDVPAKYMKLSVQGTGTVTDSSCAVRIVGVR